MEDKEDINVSLLDMGFSSGTVDHSPGLFPVLAEEPHALPSNASLRLPELDFSLLADQEDDRFSFMDLNMDLGADFGVSLVADSPQISPEPHHSSLDGYVPKDLSLALSRLDTAIKCIPDASDPCSFCQGGLYSYNTSHGRIASFSFKCSIRETEKNTGAFKFAVGLSSDVNPLDSRNSLLIPFSVWNEQSIHSIGLEKQRNCLIFRMSNELLIHVMCLTPLQSRGSLSWSEGVSEHYFLGLEGGMKYSIEVYSLIPSVICTILPLHCDGMISELRKPSSALFPFASTSKGIDEMVKDTPRFAHSDAFRPAKKARRGGGRQNQLESILPSEKDSSQCIPCINPCRMSNTHLMASFEFNSTISTGPKNLRQKSHHFMIQFGPFAFQIRFKVYADSTIRRGKKSLRQKCFVFTKGPISVHIQSDADSKGRRTLKWTKEKKEQFLALEAESYYSLHMFSKEIFDTVPEIMPVFSSDIQVITNWTNTLSNSSIDHSNEKSIDLPPLDVKGWILEPNHWNIALNPCDALSVMLLSLESPLPLLPPTATLSGGHLGVNPVHLEMLQFDFAKRRSLALKIPRTIFFSIYNEAEGKGVSISSALDFTVFDQRQQKVWQTVFTFETGIQNTI